jgi:hypothetical protein
VYATTLANLADIPYYPAPVLLIIGAVAAQYVAGPISLDNPDDLPVSPKLVFEFALTHERSGVREGPVATEYEKQPVARNIELTGPEIA